VARKAAATPPRPTTVAYIRVSTTKQAERGISLETQREAIQRYADTHEHVIAHWYTDVLSGTRADRPQYQSMLGALVPGTTVLVWRLDRIGRNKAELFRFFEECKQRGVSLISVTQPEMSNELARDLLSVIAAFESQQTSERVVANMATLAEQGQWLTTPPLFYTIGPDKRLVPTPDSGMAQQAWDTFLATGNAAQTAASYGLGLRRFKWMLSNRAYCGDTVWSGIEVRDTHPAIVRRETWDAAYAIATMRRHGSRRERPGPHLLTGFLYVEDSDTRMHHHWDGAHRNRYYHTVHDLYYAQPRHVVRADVAEEAVLAELCGAEMSPAEARRAEAMARARLRTDPDRRERERVQRRLTLVETEQVETGRMAAQHRLDAATYERMRLAQERDRAELTAALAALAAVPDLAAVRVAVSVRRGLATLVNHAWDAGNITALRILIEGLIARVEVWGAVSPPLRGGQATAYWRDNPPEIRVRWRPELSLDLE